MVDRRSLPEGAEPPGCGTPPAGAEDDTAPTPTDAQLIASSRGVQPDPDKILDWDRLGSKSFNLIEAARAVLSIRTNVILIVASACGYFYLSGIETFAAEFVKEQFSIDQLLANLLLLVVGGGAILGVLISGNLSDRLLKRGYLNARIVVAAVAALAATFLFVPALTTRSAVTALPYLTLAGLMLSAQNPPIDAARLDIVPALLWGRAGGHSHPAAVVGPVAGARAVRSGVGPRVRGRAQRPAVDLRRHVGVHGGQRGDPAASHPHLPARRGDRGGLDPQAVADQAARASHGPRRPSLPRHPRSAPDPWAAAPPPPPPRGSPPSGPTRWRRSDWPSAGQMRTSPAANRPWKPAAAANRRGVTRRAVIVSSRYPMAARCRPPRHQLPSKCHGVQSARSRRHVARYRRPTPTPAALESMWLLSPGESGRAPPRDTFTAERGRGGSRTLMPEGRRV